GRDDAAGRVSVPLEARVQGAPDLRRARDQRAPPAPLRGEQRVPGHARGARLRLQRAVAGRRPRRDHRAAGPPVVHRLPVPSGAEVEADAAAPAVRVVHPRRHGAARPRAPGRRGPGTAAGRGRGLMGSGLATPLFRPDGPFFLIAGPCVLEDDALNLGIAETLAGLAADLGLTVLYKASF